MRRLRSRESSSFDAVGGEQLDGDDSSVPEWDTAGNRSNLIGEDVDGGGSAGGAASRVERKVQGLVGKLKSSMKGLGLPSRGGSLKNRSDVDDPEVQARTAAIFGSQPTSLTGRHSESHGAVQPGKVGFKMNRFSLPVFAAAVGAELRGYGVMDGGDGAATFESVDAAQDPDDPWSSAQQQHDAPRAAGSSWPSESGFGDALQNQDPWSSSSSAIGPTNPWSGPAYTTLPGSVATAELRPRDYAAPDRSPPTGSLSREGSQPRGFSLQIGGSASSSRESSLSPMAASATGVATVPFHASGRSRPSAPSFEQSEVISTPAAAAVAATGIEHGRGGWPQAAADGEELAAFGSGDGGVRIGKLKLPSIRRMAEAAVDVLRGPTDGMEAQLPVGGRDPSSGPLTHDAAASRQDVRTILRERLQRGFRRSSSASAALATMAGGGNDFWSGGGSGGSQSTSASSYGHLPSASVAAGGYED